MIARKIDKLLPQPEPLQSFALFDDKGKLAAWDYGLELEWSAARHLIRRGASYAEIVHALATAPGTETFMKANFQFADLKRHVEARIAGFGCERSHLYQTAAGRTMQVDERPIASGGIWRSARDITDEKQVESALAEAQQRLDAIDLDEYGVLTEPRRTPEGVYIFEPISAGLCRLLGLPAELVGGDPMLIYSRFETSEEDNARRAALMENGARTLESFVMEYRIRDGDNRVRWVRQSMMPRREADGTVIFSGVMRDVTREKEAEDQVEMLRSVAIRSTESIVIFESAPVPEDDTRIIYVNAKFSELFGWSADEVIGKPAEFLTANRPVMAGPPLVRALLRDSGESAEFETSSSTGRAFWVEARIATIQRFDDGRFRWVVMSHDISERRAAQDALLRAKEEAEASSRAKGEFLANMSHELRTPLNAIIGFTELIEQSVARTGWTPSYTEYLGDVGDSGRHLLDLINTVLDLSKIEAGQLALDLAEVDLGELLRRTLTLLSGMARDGGIVLSADIPVECPDIPGDYLKLKQVVLNIVSNAIKFTPPGGTITVELGFTETDAVIAVADTGCGIPAKDLERVMLPFVQVGSALSRKYDGAGLGLSIARELCGLHDGRLEISSTEGEGTTVRILLPLSAAGSRKAGRQLNAPSP